MPLSLEHLRTNPLAEGMYFPGDLLEAVLRADSRFWLAHFELRAAASEIAQRAFLQASSLRYDRQGVQASISDAFDIFRIAYYFAKHGRA